jgi:hypothetical protein
VRQPWAGAIIHLGKSPENRTRNIAGSYRGPVAIHAGLVPDPMALADPVFVDAHVEAGGPLWEPRGAFIGVVDLVDVLEPHSRCSFCSPWAMENHWHLMLANPRPLPEPIPARGRLGLWTPDPAAVEQMQAVTK